MPLKFVTVNDNVFRLLGDEPPDPLPGLRPWTPLGDFRPPDRPPRLCSSKIFLKNPLQQRRDTLALNKLQSCFL